MLRSSQNLPDRIENLRARMAAAAARAGRNVDSVTLLTVSKGQPAELIRAGAAAGLTDIGESYLTEALAKMEESGDLPVTWHFIGRLQANKTRPMKCQVTGRSPGTSSDGCRPTSPGPWPSALPGST